MKKITIIISWLFFTNFVQGQDKENYMRLINEADKHYQSKEYLQAGFKFSEAFVLHNYYVKTVDRYNAARAWALANEADSAFAQLFQIAINENYSNVTEITENADFKPLYSDQRWKLILEFINQNNTNIDKPLAAKLDSIFNEDQKYRLQINDIQKKYGQNSEELKQLFKIIQKTDSLNLIEVKKILDKKGWVGSDIVGTKGNHTLFLIIQHADLKTMETYLPALKEAVSNGNAIPADLALIEDRIAMYKNKHQIYGSQILVDSKANKQYVFPLADPDNVDKRRAEAGLEKMADYLARFGMTWNLEEYKKELSKLEAEYNIK
jgi:hypothetical protein